MLRRSLCGPPLKWGFWLQIASSDGNPPARRKAEALSSFWLDKAEVVRAGGALHGVECVLGQ